MRPTLCCEGPCDKSRDHLAKSSSVVACKAAQNFKLLGLDGHGGGFVLFSFDRRRTIQLVQCNRLCLGFSFQMLEDPLPAPQSRHHFKGEQQSKSLRFTGILGDT